MGIPWAGWKPGVQTEKQTMEAGVDITEGNESGKSMMGVLEAPKALMTAQG